MIAGAQIVAVASALMLAVMAAVWALAVRIRNAGIVDVAWSLNFSLLAALYAGFASGHLPRRLLIAGMMTAWSLRLGLYLHRRVMGQHPLEDGRYRQLREAWGPRADRRFFWFFQAQGALALVLSLPVLLACMNPEPRIQPLEWAAVSLWLLAVVGEAVADAQLDRFRRDPANRGRTCQAGLWRTSRHPNYFFEWLAWVSFFLFASASPWGWTTVYAPLVMLYSILRVTGIPATEAQALRTRGDEYREYQRTTSAFVPWFRRGVRTGDSNAGPAAKPLSF